MSELQSTEAQPVPAPENAGALVTSTDSPIQAIAKMASAGVGTEVIEQMKGLVEWDDARQAKAKFNSSFSKAKQGFKKAKKSGYNAHLKTHYSTLEDYDDATRAALSENGLAWRHTVKTLEGDVTAVTCVLAHEGGHSEETGMTAPSYSMTNNAINKLQSVGIVEEYLRRMTLKALLGLVSDSEFDNDGNGGAQHEVITESQAADLSSLADEVEADKNAFLKYLSAQCKCEIGAFSAIPAKAHKIAVAALEAKRKAPKKGEKTA